MKIFTRKGIGLRTRISYYVDYVKIVLVWMKKWVRTAVISGKKHIKMFPSTIQLPVTYKCNFNCKMCGMHNLIHKVDYSINELEQILKDKLFGKVTSVGLNGGEPFMRSDLVECVKVMIQALPNLKNISIITNGYFTESIGDKLLLIYEMSKKREISINVSISVDGIDRMQDLMRGHEKAWENAEKTLKMISTDMNKYCDYLGIICTVTRYNVYNLEEVEVWSKKKNIPVRYNIATVNLRIDNLDKYEDFSIFSDEKARLIAQEFFYKKAIQENSETYFGIYLYIREKRRYAYCPCQYNDWVTLIPNGNISYCATYSKELGSALEQSAYDIFNGNIQILQEIRKNNCTNCSHYISQLDVRGLNLFYKEILKNNRVLF